MKTKRFILQVMAMVVAAQVGVGIVSAGTNEVSGMLQRGLFEEEANHNLDAAIQAYQSVITQTDKDHQFAATAIFRLGECYRKQGKTNEANAQYQRILREFPDQAELVKLSREYAGRSGVVSSSSGQIVLPWLQAQQAVASSFQRQIDELAGMSLEKRRVFAQQRFPNPVLDSLIQKMAETEQTLAGLKSSQGEHHPDVERTAAALKTIYQQIDSQIDGIVTGLVEKRNEAAATVAASEQLIKEAGQTTRAGVSAAEQAASMTPSEADEIKRLQAMIKDSPDLINGNDDGSSPLNSAVRNGQLAVAKFLLDNKADTEVVDSFAKTPLLSAVQAGRKEMAELLLERGANVNATVIKEKVARNSMLNDGENGRTSLHYAAFRGYKGVAETLLAHGAKVDAKDTEGKTPLHLAAKNGFKSVVETLLARGADVNARDNQGATALFAAVGAGNKAIVELLLARGANVNAKDDQGATAFFEAVGAGNKAIVELLLANKADVNLKTKAGLTPLIASVNANQLEIAKLLLERGADAKAKMADNHPSTPRWTALVAAVALNNDEMVKLLLENQADPNATFDSGDRGNIYERDSTPLILAAQRGQKETAQILLAHKANVNWTNAQEITALMRAVSKDDRNMAALLLDNKARTDTLYRGRTALHHVVSGGKKAMAELLLAHGADINARDNTGKTALHLAVSSGARAMVELLLAHGADVNLKDDQGNAALDLPGASSANEIGVLLRQHGAVSALERSIIRITRGGQVAQGVVFRQDANAYNHHTLFEAIAYTYPHQLGLAYVSPTTHRDRDPELPGFYFPDFAHVKIRRLEANGSTNTLSVDLAAALASGDCSKNLTLNWGDIVELPELDHNVSENWEGLSQPLRDTLKKCLERQVEIVVNGKTNKVTLAPNPPTGRPPPMQTKLEAEAAARAKLSFFWLSDVVRGAKVLLASSDLTGLKVKRVDPISAKTQWLAFSLEKIDEHSDLWLQDGDVIEIPEKQ